MKKTTFLKELEIFIENMIILAILLAILLGCLGVFYELIIYYDLLGYIKTMIKPKILTHNELVELLKTKNIPRCQNWPSYYPNGSEMPCYIKGIDKDGDKYCDVFYETLDRNYHACRCRDFWEFMKDKLAVEVGKPIQGDVPRT